MARQTKIRFALILLVAALATFVTVFETFKVPTPSMEPTLALNDIVLANEFSFVNGAPRRGDIVIYRADSYYTIRGPVAAAENRQFRFLKRVAGLPGESILVGNNTVLINDKTIDLKIYTPYRDDDSQYPTPHYFGGPISPYTIPSAHFYLLGDNPKSSNDSRYNGSVDAANIYAKVVAVVWPPSKWQLL